MMGDTTTTKKRKPDASSNINNKKNKTHNNNNNKNNKNTQKQTNGTHEKKDFHINNKFHEHLQGIEVDVAQLEAKSKQGEKQDRRKIKFTHQDNLKNQELTSALFSDALGGENESKKKKKQKVKEEHDALIKEREEEEEQEEELKPAWIDEDDEVTVQTKNTVSREINPMTGHAYQSKLRTKHKAAAVQSDSWAQLQKPEKRGDDDSGDEDGDAILYRSQPLTMPNSRISATTLEIIDKKSSVQLHQSAVRRVSIHPITPTAFSIDGNTIKVYHLGEKIEQMHSIKMQDMDITDACFSVEGDQIFICGNQPSLYFINVISGTVSFMRNVLGRKEKTFMKICASPDGKSLALLGRAGAIVLLSTVTKQMLAELRGPSNSVYSAAFDPDGRLYASYAGGTVLVWDLTTRTPIHTFTNPSLQFATAIAISPDGQYLAIGTNVGIVDVFLTKEVMESENPQPHKTLDNLRTSVNTIKFNHDTQLMAIGTDIKKQGLRLLHIPTFTVYQHWPLHTTFALLKDVSFSPAGGFLMTGENTGRVKMFRFPHYPAA